MTAAALLSDSDLPHPKVAAISLNLIGVIFVQRSEARLRAIFLGADDGGSQMSANDEPIHNADLSNGNRSHHSKGVLR